MSGELHWFDESPDAGDPRCRCSYCGERIEEEKDDFGQEAHGLRMWCQDGQREMRFHDPCFYEVWSAVS